MVARGESVWSGGRGAFMGEFVPGQFVPGDFSGHFKLLTLLKLDNLLFDLLLFVVLEVLAALSDCLPDLVEPRNYVLRYLELQTADVLILDVFYRRTDKLFVHALA